MIVPRLSGTPCGHGLPQRSRDHQLHRNLVRLGELVLQQLCDGDALEAGAGRTRHRASATADLRPGAAAAALRAPRVPARAPPQPRHRGILGATSFRAKGAVETAGARTRDDVDARQEGRASRSSSRHVPSPASPGRLARISRLSSWVTPPINTCEAHAAAHHQADAQLLQVICEDRVLGDGVGQRRSLRDDVCSSPAIAPSSSVRGSAQPAG